MSSPNRQTNQSPLKGEDIHAGLSVLQTIYAVAMVLGFENALNASYDLFISPFSSPSGALPHPVVLLVFGVILLLGLRFFWVPRILYAYLLTPGRSLKNSLQWMMPVHVPITMFHTLLFYCVCEAYTSLAKASASSTSALAEKATWPVVFYAALILLNAIWLFRIGSMGEPDAESTWKWNNLLFGSLALVVVGIFVLHEFSTVAFIVIASLIFMVNSLVDLFKESGSYFLFPHAGESS